MMRISINQPAYLPWLGYFHRIAASDLHVVLDHVQFEKNSFVNRNKVRTAEGWCWLTVPLRTTGLFGSLAIEGLRIADDPRWRRKHWDTLRGCYSKAPYFKQHESFFGSVYTRTDDSFFDLIHPIERYLLDAFGIKTPLVRSSQLPVRGVKAELVLNLCRHFQATEYLSGPLGRDYLDEKPFTDAGIRLTYQDYRHPAYPQCQKGPFEPYMAAMDLLFNCGPDSLEILMGGQAIGKAGGSAAQQTG